MARAIAMATAAPEMTARLVLDAFVWTGEGSPTLIKRREGIAQFRASNKRAIDRDYIKSIFLRDGPEARWPLGCTEADRPRSIPPSRTCSIERSVTSCWRV